MGTIAELKAIKQQLRDKTPLIYQAEICDGYNYFVWNKDKIISPNTIIDAKIALIKEALAVLNGGTFNLANITKLYNNFNGDFKDVINNLNKMKKGEALDTYFIEGYTKIGRSRAMPSVYQDSDFEIEQLTAERDTAKTAQATAEQAKTKAEGERDETKKAQTKAEQDATKHLKDKEKAETDLKEANAAKAKAEKERDEANTTAKNYENLYNKATDSTNNLNKAKYKLLAIYVEQIKRATQLFYQDLSLDNNWVNEKYGDKNISYLELLKGLTTESEPEEVINAFRVIALITATDKAQESHDKYKDRLAKLPANLKKMNLNKFNKIKDTWELLEGEPKAENNPLYLPVIKEKNNYITKIKEIINLWQ